MALSTTHAPQSVDQHLTGRPQHGRQVTRRNTRTHRDAIRRAAIDVPEVENDALALRQLAQSTEDHLGIEYSSTRHASGLRFTTTCVVLPLC